MEYSAIDFFVRYDAVFLSAAFLLVWLFGAANFCKNPYAGVVKRFRTCHRNLLKNPHLAGMIVSQLPQEYKRQWRAYANGNAARPSLVFEFVPRKRRLCCGWLVAAGATVSTGYLAIFVCDVSRIAYAVFQFAFWLSFAVAVIASDRLFAKREKRARQTFGKFIVQLNVACSLPDNPLPGDLAKRLNLLKAHRVDDSSLQEASQLLKNSSDAPRTVEQQRKINAALNGLLQAYAKGKA